MSPRGFRRRGGDLLEIECWCRESVVYVTADVVRACLTDSCGRPGCKPPQEAA